MQTPRLASKLLEQQLATLVNHSPGGARSGVGWQDAVGHGGDEAEILMPHGAILEAHAAGDADGGGMFV